MVTTAPALERHDRQGVPRAALRLGVVPYLNVAPIIRGLAGDPRFELQADVPSRLADRLHRGEIDLCTLPSVEYAEGDYAIVPGVAIASQGRVRSVRLFHRGPLEAVRTVALDSSSRTSVALLRILLQQRLDREPEYFSRPPDLSAMLEVADAALLIGDPALYAEETIAYLDLGEEWNRVTGLPFVYAVWAGPSGAVDKEEVLALQASLAAGLGALPEIARSYGDGRPSRSAENLAYLTANMHYALGERECQGLIEFYRRAHALSLIPRVPELRFHAAR
jgi:chorismate dehydratase